MVELAVVATVKGHDGSCAQHRFILVEGFAGRRSHGQRPEEATQALHVATLLQSLAYPRHLLGAEIQDGQLEHRGSPGGGWTAKPGAGHAAEMPVCAGLSSVKQLRAAGTHSWGGGGGTTAGGKREGGIGGAGSTSRVWLSFVRARRRRAGASTGVGGLAAQAPWRPPVSHWPALPIKSATRLSGPFQHLPVLDSARRSPVDFSSVFCRTWKGKDLPVAGQKREARATAFQTPPAPALFFRPLPPSQRGNNTTGIHFGVVRCLDRSSAEDKEDWAKSKSSKNSTSLVLTKQQTVRGAHEWGGRGNGSPHFFPAPIPACLTSFSSCQSSRVESESEAEGTGPGICRRGQFGLYPHQLQKPPEIILSMS